MRPALLLLLLGFTACAADRGPPPPCNPPFFVDVTGSCVSASANGGGR